MRIGDEDEFDCVISPTRTMSANVVAFAATRPDRIGQPIGQEGPIVQKAALGPVIVEGFSRRHVRYSDGARGRAR